MLPSDFSPYFEEKPLPEYIPFSFAESIRDRLSKEVVIRNPLAKFHSNLKSINDYVREYNQDWVFQVCGPVGSGKSTLALQLAYFLDPRFDMKTQMIWDMKDFANFNKKEMYGETPFRVMLFDEAISVLFSRDGMQGRNTDLIKWITKVRACNYYIIFVVPNFWSIDVKIRDDRAKTMLMTMKNMEQKNMRHYYGWYDAMKLSLISYKEEYAKKIFKSPKVFMKHFRPNFMELFPRLDPAIEKVYLKYKKTDYRTFTDDLIRKYTPKEKKD